MRLKYLHIYRARNGLSAYYRRDGVSRRLTDDRGRPVNPDDTEALMAAWTRAHAAFRVVENNAKVAGELRETASKTIADLISRYRKSVDFEWLKPATKRDYEKALGPLERAHGHLSVITLQPHHVRQLRDRYATRRAMDPARPGETLVVGNVRQANRMIAVLSILMNFARGSLGWRSDNPAERPRRLPSTGEGYRTWTRENFDQFMACPSIEEPLKRAAAMGWFTGQRKGDCLTMTRTARAGGWIEVVPAKTSHSSGARRMVMEHPELTRILDAAPPSAAVTLLTRADGRPWRIDHFNHRFAAAVREAALAPGLSFHGLRKGFMAWAAERGATDAELDSIVPHSDPRVRARYRAAADQKGLARGLMGRLSRKDAEDV